ncbi:MAG: hypothetical protein ACHQ1D_06535 [Nitrososphaerales archaeon]
MNFKLTLLISLILFSCKDKTSKSNPDDSIPAKVYQTQMVYLDKTLLNYAEISKKGEYYYLESSYLDKIAAELQVKIENGENISDEANKFYNHFEKTFENHGLIDINTFNEIKKLPIKTISDIDYLRLYVKNNFVCILLNNKLLPFDSWSTMASAERWTIKDGEEFQVSLSNTAWSSSQPHEWFLVDNENDSLARENIIDTLYQNEIGVVNFKTKNYHKGENKLTFVSKLNSPTENSLLSRQIKFIVK